MTYRVRTHARCTMCGKHVRRDSCRTLIAVRRKPLEEGAGRRWRESRGATWVYCDECAETLEKWMDYQKGRVPEWRNGTWT